jgi:hypothetical protein
MKERPIIFSTELIPKILDGSKTQRRRVIKIPEGGRLKSGADYCPPNDTHNGGVCVCFDQSGLADFRMLPCPYGQVGDRLWVREAFCRHSTQGIVYRADNADSPLLWKPSIHMYRDESRITLEITGVRVERLQEISREDIRAEGVDVVVARLPYDPLDPVAVQHEAERETFTELWDSLNAKHPWESNPWVWVIEFKVSEVAPQGGKEEHTL